MTKTPNQIDPPEARQLIGAAEASESAVLKRAAAPVWFSTAMALLLGGLVAAFTVGVTEWVALALLGIAGLVTARHSALPIAPRSLPDSPAGILGFVALIVGLLALIAGARFAREALALDWAPLAAGCLAALIVLGLAMLERKRAGGKRKKDLVS